MGNIYDVIDKELNPREWYLRGKAAESSDPETGFIIKFIFHWIAFNMMYEMYGGVDNSTRYKIKEMYRMNSSAFDRYDAFSDPAIAIFMEKPVYGAGEQSKDDFEKVKHNNALALLYTIYRVRNNLFLGSKTMRDPRNIELVRCASIILEKYMHNLIYGRNANRG